MRIILFCLLVTLIINTPTVFAEHNEEKGPEKFGRYVFKEQDIDAATKACDAGGKPGPEFVPTVRDKEPNLALLKDAKAEASSLLGGGALTGTALNILTTVSTTIVEVGLLELYLDGHRLILAK